MARKIFPRFTAIKEYRTDRSWSQDWTAQAAGISTRTYQRIEGGDGCSFEILKSLAAAFEVDFKTLLPAQRNDKQEGADLDSFTPSWVRLIKAFVWRVVVLPFILAFLVVSSLSSLLGASYLAHKAEVVYISAFVPMTDEEREFHDAKIAEILKNDPDHPLYSMGPVPAETPMTEAEGYRAIIMIFLALSILLWCAFFGIKYGAFLYNRDFQILIDRPVKRRVELFSKTLKLWVFRRKPVCE